MKRSLDLREQALRAFGQGLSRAQVCQVFGIHRTTLRRWQVREQEGRLAPLRSLGARRKLGPEDQARLEIQDVDLSQLVFLDECGVHTAMHRRYGRAPRGERSVGVVPRNWKHSTTILGALSPHGVQAVMSLEGATDRFAFEAFIEQVLLPTLLPGQVVVMDNLSAHKSAKAQQLVEEAGCSWLFLPPYSPDFNPIERLSSIPSKGSGASSRVI